MEEEKLSLNGLDRRIISELDIDARQPISRLAKKVRTSRSVVDYKIRRMENAGFIKNYVALLDPGKLGVMIWNVYIEFYSMTKEAENGVLDYIKKHQNVWWAAKTAGKWNFIYSVVVKNIKEFENINREFSILFGKYILQQVIVAHGEVDIISRSYVNGTAGISVKWFEFYEPMILEENEKKILIALGQNSRITINELTKKTGMDPKTVASKIKKLEKSKVIARYRLQLDPHKIGLSFYKAIIYLKDYSGEKDKKLLNYCKECGNIFHYERKVGPWPLELEMNIASYEKAEELMSNMKERFNDFIESYDLLLIKEEIKGELDLADFIYLK